jgi:hypothetical protein
MFFFNFRNKSPLWHISSQKVFVYSAVLLMSLSLFLLTSSPTVIRSTPQVQLSASPHVVATAWTAELRGKLSILDGCIRVIENKQSANYLLVWPPDITATIDKNTIQITTGVVTGNKKIIVLQDGEGVYLSGGETTQPGSPIPSNCKGPYWVVGFEIGPDKTQNS